MGPFAEFPLLTIFVLVIAGYLVTRILSSPGGPKSPGGKKICHACGAEHEAAARYCRRCGRSL